MKQKIIPILTCILSLSLLVLLVTLPNRRPEQADDTPADTQGSTTANINREDFLVGVCLPDQTSEWADTAYLLKCQLEDKGYQVDFAYGDGTAEGQQTALSALLDKVIDCLVIAPVDSAAFPDGQILPSESNLPILSYGSLLLDTDQVSGHICYDYAKMGAAIANSVEKLLALDTAAGDGRSYTVELFMGAPRNYNALLLHQGIRSVLDPYLDAGVLECKSGRLAFEDSCITGWSADVAATACTTRLEKYYPDTAPNLCITASDSIAAGVIDALENAGVTPEYWPLITGNGATAEGRANLADGKQCLTVSMDPADPARACADMVDWVLFEIQPEFPLAELDNHVVSVPTALCEFHLILE